MSRLFVSDVHLDASTPDANEQFLQFLRTHAADAEALYILGDLFEVWVGDDDPDPTKARICEGLRELTAGGAGRQRFETSIPDQVFKRDLAALAEKIGQFRAAVSGEWHSGRGREQNCSH